MRNLLAVDGVLSIGFVESTWMTDHKFFDEMSLPSTVTIAGGHFAASTILPDMENVVLSHPPATDWRVWQN